MHDLGHNQVASELQDIEMSQHKGNTQVSPFYRFAHGCATDELSRCTTWSSIQTWYALTLDSIVLESSKANSYLSIPHPQKIQTDIMIDTEPSGQQEVCHPHL